MLHCVFHPTKEMRVVSTEEYEDLLASGVWFDNPGDAKKMREDYERQILDESKHTKPQTRKKERNNE